MRLCGLLWMCSLLGSAAVAQELEPRLATSWATTLQARVPSDWSEPAPRHDGGVFALDPAAGEAIAARLAPDPAPISREFLDGSAEELVRFHGLPGGIVLGRVARPVAELASELDGARIERTPEGGLALRLADGTVLRGPAIPLDTLRACLEFLAGGSDALVDLQGAYDPPKLAPAFAGSAVAPLLVRMDGVPHATLPMTRAWKSVIVDREVRVRRAGDELVLAADLEVRFYDDPDGSGRARRVGTIDVLGVDFVGPRPADDWSVALAPLAELAGWLGFLSWAARTDAVGVAALRGDAALIAR